MAGLGDLNRLPQTNGDGSEPAYRMSMLPFGTYKNSDGTESLGLALPAMIHEPLMAVERLFGSGNFAKGPDAPGNADDMRTLLFSMYGGNALSPGRLMEGAAARAAPEAAAPYALYRGAQTADKMIQGDRPLFMSSSPHVAGTYARDSGSVAPMQANFENPLVVDAQGRAWNDIPFNGNWADTNHLAFLARDAGHDGLVIKNVMDHANTGRDLPPADTVVALKRGTVTSPLSGETLYSDTGKPSLMGAAVAGAEGPQRAYRGALNPGNIARENAATLWGSSSPDVASTYARTPYGDGPVGSVAPADFSFENPLVVDASGNSWMNIPYEGGVTNADSLAFRARSNGHDGLVIRNVQDAANRLPGEEKLPLADTYAALKRGTVTSPLTGETLFSDTGLPSIWGSALYPDQDPQGSYASGGNVADTSGLSGLRSIPDYGFGPMTPTTIAGRPNGFISSREPDPTWGDLALSAAEFPARATVGQFDAAGTGIADAIDDPSLANITNAGVQSGLAMMSPTLTAVSGLGGLGLAALRDSDLIPSAEARRLHRAPHQAPPPPVAAPPEVDPVFEKIKDDPSLLALYQQIKVEQNNATRDYPGRNGDASRAAAAARVQELQGQFSAALAKRDAVKQGIYDQQVQNALAARDVELGRDRRFSDTEVGKVYDKLGGYAPLVAGFVPGVVSRLAYGPATNLVSKALRAFTGATFGVGANNVPLAYNAFATEVDNPEQRAYEAYAYNLPDGHPDKAKAQAMAEKLPTLNPLRVQAAEELYDPEKFKERALMGALEGFGGNELGQMTPSAIGALGRRSSLQLPERAIMTNNEKLGIGALNPEARAQQEAAAKLLADKQAAPPLSSGPDDLAAGNNLPVPAKKAPGAGRRSKSAGTKGSSKPAKVTLETPPASPDSQTAASDELKRFLGFRKAPDLTDLKAAGGAVEGRGEGGKVFSGPLHSDVAGRTDHIPTTVRAGSFVVPADVVSALGESNTLAGTKVLDHMFPKQPEMLHYAAGGKVPILAAGGEYVIPPESVAQIGGGDLERGHNVLDQFVLNTRNDTIKTLKSLPGPQK